MEKTKVCFVWRLHVWENMMKCPWGDVSAEQQETEMYSAVSYVLEQRLHLIRPRIFPTCYLDHMILMQSHLADCGRRALLINLQGWRGNQFSQVNQFAKPVHSALVVLFQLFPNKSALFPLLGSAEHSCPDLTGDWSSYSCLWTQDCWDTLHHPGNRWCLTENGWVDRWMDTPRRVQTNHKANCSSSWALAVMTPKMMEIISSSQFVRLHMC